MDPIAIAKLEEARQKTLPPVVLPDALGELRGPAIGVVTLPVWVDWSPSSTYDLSFPRRVQSLYQTVLQQARSKSDLSTHLNEEVLVDLWDSLSLPARLRAAWEGEFPELCAGEATVNNTSQAT